MNPTVRVGIVGATGYTALEAARLLAHHPRAELTVATSRAEAGKQLADVHPSLVGHTDVAVTQFNPLEIARQCDVAMSCLPHGASAETVRQLIDAGLRVIDFSADFRLSRLDVYKQWYGVEHPWPERVGNRVYGMPEFFADQIRAADLVANPGCYPTSVILPLVPLVRADLIQTDDIIVDSKSGVSGAGRSVKPGLMYCEANESISAYAVGGHRHQPEMEDLVGRVTGASMQILFSPHLTPMDRGILSTIYARPKSPGIAASEVIECWREAFAEAPFVHVVDHLPATKHVAGTNHVHLSIRDGGDRVILVSAADNLVKGASGAAIQNMNVMFAMEETAGLR